MLLFFNKIFIFMIFLFFIILFLLPVESNFQKNLTVEFILTNQYASGIIRGDIVSSFLNELPGASSRVLQINNFFDLPATRPQSFQLLDFCICVKCRSISDSQLTKLIDHCHDLGGLFGWDILDYFPPIHEIHYHVDFWLVTNTLIQNFFLESLIPPERIFLLPHPHTNFQMNHSRIFCPLNILSKGVSPLTVGFTSSSRNIDHSMIREIKKKLQDHGLQFELIPTPEPSQDAVLPSRENLWHQDGVHTVLSQVDLAMIWPGNNLEGFELTARPGTRLVSWMSNGIPTVFFPEQAYLDVCNDLPFSIKQRCLNNAVGTIDQTVNRLVYLSHSPKLRNLYCQDALTIASKYSIQNSTKQLYEILHHILDHPTVPMNDDHIKKILESTKVIRERSEIRLYSQLWLSVRQFFAILFN